MPHCPNCNNNIEIDAKKCANCDARFDSADAWKPVPEGGSAIQRSRAPSLTAKIRGKGWVGVSGQLIAWSISIMAGTGVAFLVWVGVIAIVGLFVVILSWMIAFAAFAAGLYTQEFVWLSLSDWVEHWLKRFDSVHSRSKIA